MLHCATKKKQTRKGIYDRSFYTLVRKKGSKVWVKHKFWPGFLGRRMDLLMTLL